MKGCAQFLLAIFLHPIAAVLMWIHLAGRADLSATQKLIWAIVGFIWGIGPIIYILFGGGSLW